MNEAMNSRATDPMPRYECQVWDSVTREWASVVVSVPRQPGDPRASETQHKLGQSMNVAVANALEEPDLDWLVYDCHTMNAAGEEVTMVQLRSIHGDDISVILAIPTPGEA